MQSKTELTAIEQLFHFEQLEYKVLPPYVYNWSSKCRASRRKCF